jgi:hypothetical protein
VPGTTNPRKLANARRGLALADAALRLGKGARRCSRTRGLRATRPTPTASIPANPGTPMRVSAKE